MEAQLVSLLQELQQADNTARHTAEQALAAVVAQDPSAASLALLTMASKPSYPIADRQSALLCLKRLVPRHWSVGFESFVGPGITVEAKAAIRPRLLELSTQDDNSKVRSGAAYAVTQIAAVDYPDEWPDLLDTLYGTVINGATGVLGALALLQELFDDLVTEQQFFGGNVGVVTIGHCMKLMADSHRSAEIRTAAAKLYKACLLTLCNSEAFEDEAMAHGLKQHFAEMSTMLTVLLQSTTMDIHELLFRTVLYTIATQLVTEIPEEIVEHNAKLALQREVTNDLIQASSVYVEVVVQEDSNSSSDADSELMVTAVFNNLIIEQLQLLSALNEFPLTQNSTNINLPALYDAILACTLMPLEMENDFSSDFNLMITEETGVSADFGPRNAVFDFLTELPPEDVASVFEWFLSRLSETVASSSKQWKEKEACLHCLDSLFRHDTDFRPSRSLVVLLNSFISLLQDPEPFIRGRTMVIIPAFLSKFKSGLGGEFPVKCLLECLRQAHNDSELLCKAMFLLGLTYFNATVKFDHLPKESQHVIMSVISSVLEEAVDDTPPLLTEALTISLKIHTGTNTAALSLLFQIASKDPGNIQLVLDVEEALGELLMDVDLQSYQAYCETVLPGILTSLESSNGDFTSELALALQVLTIFNNSPPKSFPQELFARVNPALSNLLLQATDDQILQLGAEAYHALLVHSQPELFDINTVLQVLSKFLDPELSDSAAINVGSLVVAVLSKFSDNISSILPQILDATTRRLLTSKQFSTTEDLLSVLCLMISTDVEQTIAFLQQHNIEQVFNVWFSSFPTLTGIDRIRKNCEALSTILFFASSHSDAFQFTVDGDEVVDMPGDMIITRSMRKNMEKKYTQVSVPFKIVKLLVAELKDQCSQQAPEPEDLVGVGEDDDEGWEDVDAIGGDFDTLRGYVEADGDNTHDEDLKEYLVSFFKQVAASNVDGFRVIYNALTDEEKQILTENIV